MRRIVIALAVVVLTSISALADSLPDEVVRLVNEYWRTKDPSLLTDLTGSANVSKYLFSRGTEQLNLRDLRHDLQASSLSTSSGSTSIVARTAATDFISAAIESGAVTRKTDEKSATFGFNALPIYQLMSRRMPTGCGTINESCRSGVGLYIRGLSGSVTIDTTSTTTPIPANLASLLGVSGAAFLSTGKNLRALSARYEFFVRERDSEKERKALETAAEALRPNATAFLPKLNDLLMALDSKLGIRAASGWQKETLDELNTAESVSRFREILLTRYRVAYQIVAGSPEMQALQAAANGPRLDYIKKQNELLAALLYRKAFTLDYVHQRPSEQPWLHEFRVVVATPLGRKDMQKLATDRDSAVPDVMLTLNGGVSLYNHIPAPTATTTFGRVKSAQTSLALDWSPSAWGTVRPTYTVAYYFQYMVENGVLEFNQEALTPGGSAIPIKLPAAEVLNTKGPIHVGQIRLSIPIGSSGISFPAAVSYSSRAELITGRSFWQGHLGVTYDLSRLKSFLQSTRTP